MLERVRGKVKGFQNVCVCVCVFPRYFQSILQLQPVVNGNLVIGLD